MQATQLVLVLLLIGQESGMKLFSQSQSKAITKLLLTLNII